jgi:hypothetical protein
MTNIDIISNHIISILDWQPLNTFMGKRSRKSLELVETHGGCQGVYLVAHKDNLPGDIIDKNVGYVGKSANIFGRIYDIRSGQHGCRTYILSKGWEIADVHVKILFSEEGKETLLEQLIHEEMQKEFGYRFAWREASGGNDGALVRLLDSIDKIDNLVDLKKISNFVDEKATALFLLNWKNED